MSPEFYRGEAERTRRRAAEEVDAHAREQLLRMAAEYDGLADEMERSDASPRRTSEEDRTH
jgi:hypothetical protein